MSGPGVPGAVPYHLQHPYSSLTLPVLRKYRSGLFVETGTNVGLGVALALEAQFPRVVSVEADAALLALARAKFAGDARVDLRGGDSAAALRELCPALHEPATFYLDAHAIEQNPLLGELEALATAPRLGHVVLVDDVRMFGTPDWFGIGREHIMPALERLGAFRLSYEDTPNGAGDLLVADYREGR